VPALPGHQGLAAPFGFLGAADALDVLDEGVAVPLGVTAHWLSSSSARSFSRIAERHGSKTNRMRTSPEPGRRDEHAEVVPGQFGDCRSLRCSQRRVAPELSRRAGRPFISYLYPAARLFGERGDGAEHAARRTRLPSMVSSKL
jgi:hypothetical protein